MRTWKKGLLLAVSLMLAAADTLWMRPAAKLSDIVLPVQAAETGSIQVNYSCENGKTAIPGAEFSCVRIADASVSGGGISYILRKPYDQAGYDPNDPDYGSDAGMPERYRNIYEKQEEGTASVKTTSEKGVCRFSNCLPGMYLVWQSGAEAEAENYDVSKPLVVSVPAYEGEIFTYSAAVYPKTVRKPTAGEEPEKPTSLLNILKPKMPRKSSDPDPGENSEEMLLGWQPIPEIQPEADWTETKSEDEPGQGRKGGGTGDDSNLTLWLGIAGASLAGTGCCLWVRKRQRARP